MKHLLLLITTAITTMVSAQISTFPYVETFDGVTIPAGWTQVNHVVGQAVPGLWEFGTVTWSPSSPALSGNYAVLNSGDYGELGEQNVDLVSPTFDLSAFSSVNLHFNHFFYDWEESNATLSYSIDDGANWVEIKKWEVSSANTELFNQTIAAVAGQAQVKFKWNYFGAYDWGWAVDDITVSVPSLVTWQGDESSDWHTAGNWDTDAVPNLSDIVVIPDVAAADPVISQVPEAVCFNLTIESGASLTINAGYSLTVSNELTNNSTNGVIIKSDGSGTGSLIANSHTGTGTADIQRYMTQNRWYNVAPPVEQTISSFLTSNLDIPANGSSQRGMMEFNTNTNSWNSFFTDVSPGILVNGKGYFVRTTSDTYVTFNGIISAGTVNIPLVTTVPNWNLIGNPYTSAIKINQDAGIISFLNINESIFPESYMAVYIWDEAIDQYETINNATGTAFATLGQGFFIKTLNANATFSSEMQIHQPTESLKSGTIRPEIKLLATSSEKSVSTKIKFIEDATAGLDKGYDAGVFKADNSFSIFTKLVNDNNVEFSLQCLPTLSTETMIIPVGIDFAAGGEIVFSAQMLGIPGGSSIVLEDKLMNAFTSLNDEASLYKTTVDANSKGTGRFYLHVSGDAQVTGVNNSVENKINAWMERNEIVISGITENNAVAKLFDIRGSSILVKKLDRSATNRINVSGINTGIYMLQVLESGKRTGIKLQIAGN
jgi:hypothetical protein